MYTLCVCTIRDTILFAALGSRLERRPISASITSIAAILHEIDNSISEVGPSKSSNCVCVRETERN